MTTQPESNGMTRTQKEHTELLLHSSSLAQRLGQVIFGIGTHTAHIAIMPKQAASDLLKSAEQLEKLRGEVLDLANDIIDWEQSAIRAGVAKGIVDADGRPIAS